MNTEEKEFSQPQTTRENYEEAETTNQEEKDGSKVPANTDKFVTVKGRKMPVIGISMKMVRVCPVCLLPWLYLLNYEQDEYFFFFICLLLESTGLPANVHFIILIELSLQWRSNVMAWWPRLLYRKVGPPV